MLHLRKFAHQFGVFLEVFLGADHHLMVDGIRIFDDEADIFAGLNGDGSGDETHLVVHQNLHHPGGFFGVARLAEGGLPGAAAVRAGVAWCGLGDGDSGEKRDDADQ